MKIEDLKLEEMPVEELDALEEAIKAARVKAEKRRLDEAKKAVTELAATYGMSVEELLKSSATGSKGSKAKGVPKYQNPADADKTWTGRGRQPDWVKEHLEAGGQMEDLLIQAA